MLTVGIAKFKKIWENVSVTILDVEGNVTSVNYYLYADYFSEEIKEPQFEKEPGKYYRFLGWYDKAYNGTKISFPYGLPDKNVDLYAYNNDKLINASVEFNQETLKPTYRLLIGVPGMSNALNIASNLGLDKKIITNATEYVNETFTVNP